MNGRFLDIRDKKKPGARVLLAMSGGVDSAASAVVLREAGYDVVGLTMRNYCYSGAEAPERSCCSREAIDDARGVCARLDIPHMIANTEEIFGREVYGDFLSEYAVGRTPNPCVRCNTIVRFDTLRDTADRLGIDYYATGHYARVFESDEQRRYLARAAHRGKDQSYFLSGLSHDDLQRVLFPLGGLRKTEVRETARDARLAVAEKPESQEVCFVPDGSLREFLDGKIPLDPGDIEDTEGNVIGSHRGLGAYTVGQRRGLGVATGEPLYVVRLDTHRNTLVVGTDESLRHRELTCRLTWIDALVASGTARVRAQIRSRHDARPIESVITDGNRARVTFEHPQRAIAPGQTIAFYIDDAVVGSGVIESTGEP